MKLKLAFKEVQEIEERDDSALDHLKKRLLAAAVVVLFFFPHYYSSALVPADYQW